MLFHSNNDRAIYFHIGYFYPISHIAPPLDHSFYLRRSHAGQWVMFGLLSGKIESVGVFRGQGGMVT